MYFKVLNYQPCVDELKSMLYFKGIKGSVTSHLLPIELRKPAESYTRKVFVFRKYSSLCLGYYNNSWFVLTIDYHFHNNTEYFTYARQDKFITKPEVVNYVIENKLYEEIQCDLIYLPRFIYVGGLRCNTFYDSNPHDIEEWIKHGKFIYTDIEYQQLKPN